MESETSATWIFGLVAGVPWNSKVNAMGMNEVRRAVQVNDALSVDAGCDVTCCIGGDTLANGGLSAEQMK